MFSWKPRMKRRRSGAWDELLNKCHRAAQFTVEQGTRNVQRKSTMACWERTSSGRACCCCLNKPGGSLLWSQLQKQIKHRRLSKKLHIFDEKINWMLGFLQNLGPGEAHSLVYHELAVLDSGRLIKIKNECCVLSGAACQQGEVHDSNIICLGVIWACGLVSACNSLLCVSSAIASK